MTINGWIQIALYCGIVAALVKPLGWYMTRVFNGERTFLSPVLRPVETAFISWAGSTRSASSTGSTYAVAMLLFNAAGLPHPLRPSAPARRAAVQSGGAWPAVAPDLAFNTAVSFITNTNWQNYGGESTMSYLVQMAGLTVQNFVSAATGIALAVALIRGFARALGAARSAISGSI